VEAAGRLWSDGLLGVGFRGMCDDSCWGMLMPALFFFFLKECLPFFHVSALHHGASILPVAWCMWHLMAVFCMCLVAYFFAPQWASFNQYTRALCFSPYIGPHYDPVLVRMKSHCVCTSSCGWGVALALFVLVQRGMVWAGCHALRLSIMPSGGCLVARCNNSFIH
jgi:hypothetical protein